MRQGCHLYASRNRILYLTQHSLCKQKLNIFFPPQGPKVRPKNAKKVDKSRHSNVKHLCKIYEKNSPFFWYFPTWLPAPHLNPSTHAARMIRKHTRFQNVTLYCIKIRQLPNIIIACYSRKSGRCQSDIFYGMINTCTVTSDLLRLVIKQKSSVLFGHELCFSAETNVWPGKHESVKPD